MSFPANWLGFCKDTLSKTASNLYASGDRKEMAARRRVYLCGPSIPYNPRVRTTFGDEGASIKAWPTRGGVIVLDNAEAIDLEFLGFDPLDPPLERLTDPFAEDAFCQRLLLLGAKWWDSEARYRLVNAVEAMGTYGINPSPVDGAFYVDTEPEPTAREKRLVCAGWPSTGGGVWISESDTTWAYVDEESDRLGRDEDWGRLRMARTMDERCAVLRHRLRGKFYTDLQDYKGYGFFTSWAWKETGEVGPLLQPDETVALWNNARRGYPHGYGKRDGVEDP